MTDSPDVENAFEGALSCFVAVELEVWRGSRDVYRDLMPEGFIEATGPRSMGGGRPGV